MTVRKKKMTPPTSPGQTRLSADEEHLDKPDAHPVRFPVVGIGASAGGLDAFKKFFSAMPRDSGMAFVLVPHLDPSHRSLMVELMVRQTAMHVCEATDGMPIEPNCVYIIPPNKYLSVSAGHLRLTGPTDRLGLPTALDGFFRSLAADQQEKAIGIVLSGTGSHGTPGAREIKSVGGMVMAQDPKTAEYDQMPQNAINSGLVDYILPPEKMPEALIKYVQQPYLHSPTPALAVEGAAEQIAPVLDLLRTRNRYDFRSYRKNMLVRRIQRRMGICQIDEVPAYVAHLREHPEEITALYRDLLIGVTSFFREPEAFETLQQQVIPDLVERQSGEMPVRVWVPACATGEEAYSITILLLEQFTATKKPVNFQIFASDIDEESVEVARRGVYAASSISELSPERIHQFFVRTDENHYQVNKQLRGSLVVTRQNLISDAPFSKLDLISCRNLLIYLEPELQQKILSLFHFALNERGYLFLGCSESIGRQTDLFEPVSKKWRVYRRIGAAQRDLLQVPIVADEDRRIRMPKVEPSIRPKMGFAEMMQKLLLARFAPAAVLINRKYEVLSFSERTSDYLELPAGEPTRDLLSLARPGLRTKIRAACHKVLSGGDTVSNIDARLPRNGASTVCTICVSLLHEPKDAEGLLLVTFQDRAEEAAPSGTPSLVTEEESAVVRQLEYEVETTREDLQSTIEELQSSNEEVMSMNEELQSANEELETSKEELQSFNEELSTVNSQLQDKVEELERANNDFRNLLTSTEIATVFLDTDLRIRRFTPASAPLLNLIESDIGRPIRDFALRFTDQTLLQDAGRVLDKLTPVETEVRSEDGRCYLRQILPYRTADNRIEGVVLTFVDITRRLQSEAQSRRLATVLRDSNDAIMLLDLDGRITAWNRGAERLYGYSEAEALQRRAGDLVPEGERLAQDAVIGRIARGEEVKSFETRRVTQDGKLLDIWSTITQLMDDRGHPTAIAMTDRDITDRKQKETEIRQLTVELEKRVQQRTAELETANTNLQHQERQFRALADNVPAMFCYVDANQRYRFANKAYAEFFRIPVQKIIGMTARELLGERLYETVRSHVDEALSGKSVQFDADFEFPPGRHYVMHVAYVPEVDEHGSIVGYYALVNDVTERKRSADALAEQERRLRAIVDTAADAIITIGERGDIDSFNPAAERMFGYSAAEAIGQNVKILMPSPHREEHDEYISRYLKTGQPGIIGIGRELVGQRKDGSMFPIDLVVSKLHDGTQELFTGIIRDISERKTLQRDLLTIVSEEQRRIGQDLHDSVGQRLTGLGMLAGSLAETLQEHSPTEVEVANRIATGVEQALGQIRKLSKGLLPVEVDAEGLRAALTELAEITTDDSGIKCVFDCKQPVRIEDNETATHLYRIAQEAVTNALKHGLPKRVKISLSADDRRITLCVRDDGKGISSAAWQAEGMGLKTMKYRAALIGATLSIAPIKKGGTLVTCRLVENRNHGKTPKISK